MVIPFLLPLSAFGALLLYCITPAGALADQPAEDALISAARSEVDAETPGAMSNVERRAIAAAPGFSRREGDRLILGNSGSEHVFADTRECKGTEESPCHSYKFIAFLESRDLILMTHTRNNEKLYWLVDTGNGITNLFYDFPYVSPTGTFVVARGIDLIGTGDEKPDMSPRISLWRRRGFDQRSYVGHHDEAPFRPRTGVPVYKVDRWIKESDADGDVLFEGHVEVEGKTTVRFEWRNSEKNLYDIVDVGK